MPDAPPLDLTTLRLAEPEDLRESLAFALKFNGRKRVHNSDAFMAAIVAEQLVKYLDRAGYVVMKKPPAGGHAGLARGPRDET